MRLATFTFSGLAVEPTTDRTAGFTNPTAINSDKFPIVLRDVQASVEWEREGQETQVKVYLLATIDRTENLMLPPPEIISFLMHAQGK